MNNEKFPNHPYYSGNKSFEVLYQELGMKTSYMFIISNTNFLLFSLCSWIAQPQHSSKALTSGPLHLLLLLECSAHRYSYISAFQLLIQFLFLGRSTFTILFKIRISSIYLTFFCSTYCILICFIFCYLFYLLSKFPPFKDILYENKLCVWVHYLTQG